MAERGRPSKYDPAFADVAREAMNDGYSLYAVAGKLGVAYSTVRLWESEHEDFSAAVKEGRAGAVAWWEARARDSALNGQGNATSIIFGLKNRAPEEWKDKTEQALTGADGGPVQVQRIERVVVDPSEG